MRLGLGRTRWGVYTIHRVDLLNTVTAIFSRSVIMTAIAVVVIVIVVAVIVAVFVFFFCFFPLVFVFSLFLVLRSRCSRDKLRL